jgi:hypothetical protein
MNDPEWWIQGPIHCQTVERLIMKRSNEERSYVEETEHHKGLKVERLNIERTERKKTFLRWVLFYDGTVLVFLRWVLLYVLGNSMMGLSTLSHILRWVILSQALYDVRWILFYGGLHLCWVFIYVQILPVRSLYVQAVYGEAKVLEKRLQFYRICG